jgi:hypothetical protein
LNGYLVRQSEHKVRKAENNNTQQTNMKTTHTYAIKEFGSNVAKDFTVNINWPDRFSDFVEQVPGGEERVYALLRGFVAAHHVQSKVKAAFGAEKRSAEQNELRLNVIDGVVLRGSNFVPGERGKDDEVVRKIREADKLGKLTVEKIDELAGRWGGEADNAEELIEVYLTWKRAQAASKDLGL